MVTPASAAAVLAFGRGVKRVNQTVINRTILTQRSCKRSESRQDFRLANAETLGEFRYNFRAKRREVHEIEPNAAKLQT